ncbi:MAG: beta-ketoacyl-ACP synthase II [Chloroflexi bacterium]|nr:beta-ketoacyl-ACP synthase II [Chloroflexota bacterium]
MSQCRVVITGMGAITPLGSSVEKFWQGLIAGRSGVRRITLFDPSNMPCQIAGEVPDFEAHDFMERKLARRVPRSAQIGLAAAVQAVQNAGFSGSMPEPERAGVVFGTAIGGLDSFVDGIEVLHTQGLERVSPFVLPGGIPNLAAHLISMRFQCLGPNATITTACATGTQTIGEGAELIRRGTADVVIAGGCEALVREFSIAGFSAMRALPVNFNDNPEAASRPFDARREGFIFSEGAGAVVLERLEHAQRRGARIHAEVVGYAASSDGFHIAQPHPEGSGAIRAMQWSLQNAGILPDEIDYINAHGSSTPMNGKIETKAIRTVFGERADQIPISSTKSMIGHAMGASGTLETIVCALSINQQYIHPTINYEFPDPACDLDYVPNTGRSYSVRTALTNSFGLGGQNACLVVKRFEE